jgi:hypothetical protein
VGFNFKRFRSVLTIPQGAILNCYLPKKAGSLKRFIMNVEAFIIKRKTGSTELLNHTAIIEKTKGVVLIWEASVTKGVCPVAIDLYDEDVQFIITSSANNIEGLDRVKSQSGKKYDIKSWFQYAKFLVTHKWKGATSEQEYSKQWFCSELIYWANYLGADVEKATPNHVYDKTKHTEHWRGTSAQLQELVVTNQIKFI